MVRNGPCRLADRIQEASAVEAEGTQAARKGVEQGVHRLGPRLGHVPVAQGRIAFSLDQRQFELLPLDLANVFCVDVVDEIVDHASAVSLGRFVSRRGGG